ncbi:MAG: hypothetical protein ACRDTG_16475 [Pseudonocardiaceae bacterium]
MGFPEIPEPDDLLEWLLTEIFGPASVVVFLYLMVTAVAAWYKAAVTAIKLGKVGHSSAVRLFMRISQHSRGYRAVGVALSVAVVLIQVMWAYLAYVAGNAISRVAGVSEDVDLSRLTVDQFVRSLNWDWVSTGYVLLCAAALVHTYRYPRYRRNRTVATILSLPAYPIALFGTLGATWIMLDYLGMGNMYSNNFTKGEVILAYAMGATSIAYIIATRAALNTPGLVANYWTRST